MRLRTISEAIDDRVWKTEKQLLELPGLLGFKDAKFLGKGASRSAFDIGGKVLRISNRFDDEMFERAEKQAMKDFAKADGAIIEIYEVSSTKLPGGVVYWSISEKVTPIDKDPEEQKALNQMAGEIGEVIGENAVKTMLEDRGEADAITLLWAYRNTEYRESIEDAITDKDRLSKLNKYLDNLTKIYGRNYEDINARNTSVRDGEYTMHDV